MRACPVSCLGGAGCPLRRVGVVEAEARRAAWSCDKDPLLTLLEAAERGDFGLDGVEDTLLSREPRLTALPLRRTDVMVVAALSAGCENTKRPLGERDRSLDVSGWCSSADSAVVCARCSWDTRSDAARAISLISPRDVPPVPDPDLEDRDRGGGGGEDAVGTGEGEVPPRCSRSLSTPTGTVAGPSERLHPDDPLDGGPTTPRDTVGEGFDFGGGGGGGLGDDSSQLRSGEVAPLLGALRSWKWPRRMAHTRSPACHCCKMHLQHSLSACPQHVFSFLCVCVCVCLCLRATAVRFGW